MLFTDNFIKILVEGNRISPIFAGQLFSYNVDKKYFVSRVTERTRAGFQMRSYFAVFNAAALLLRILWTTFSKNINSNINKNNSNTHLCIMMMLVCLVPAGRYQFRCKYPEVFAKFFNEVIQFEASQTNCKNL